ISVKSDWVRGEAQTAHELTKLVPVKIEECKLPINYRGIHTPEVYKSKAELNKLAQMLTDKYRTAQPLPRGATAEPSTPSTKSLLTNHPLIFSRNWRRRQLHMKKNQRSQATSGQT